MDAEPGDHGLHKRPVSCRSPHKTIQNQHSPCDLALRLPASRTGLEEGRTPDRVMFMAARCLNVMATWPHVARSRARWHPDKALEHKTARVGTWPIQEDRPPLVHSACRRFLQFTEPPFGLRQYRWGRCMSIKRTTNCKQHRPKGRT